MATSEREITVTAEQAVSSVWVVPEDFEPGRGTAVVLAHGAGNDMSNPLLSHVHQAMARTGIMSVKFNFPYKERGARAPDRPPVLEATWRAVAAAVREHPELAPARTVLGGKSMGGRIATQIAAAGEPCDGLVLLGYPLHPPRKTQRLRAAHLPRIKVPMLFVQGTRDALCDLELLRPVLQTVTTPVTLHLIEGGDHSFKLPKRLGREEKDVWKEIVEVISGWLDAL